MKKHIKTTLTIGSIILGLLCTMVVCCFLDTSVSNGQEKGLIDVMIAIFAVYVPFAIITKICFSLIENYDKRENLIEEKKEGKK